MWIVLFLWWRQNSQLYTDDTTPYSANKANDLVVKGIEHFLEIPF